MKIKKSKTKRVLIYCRESRDDGGINYERIETQRDILVRYCEKNKLGEIIDIIMDDNMSGTSFKRLDDIKNRVRNRELDVFLCKDASRLGRNQMESMMFVELLVEYNVDIIFESERYDEDIFPLMAWFNEHRAKEDSRKIRRVLRHKMENGSMIIKAPYGYTKIGKNEMIINGEAAKVVSEIFDLYISGKGMYEIASIINSRGYPTPSQLKPQYEKLKRTEQWNKQHIDRILRNISYSGDMAYGMREKKNYKVKKYINKDKSDWIIIKDHHTPIVSRQVFEKAQACLTARTACNRENFVRSGGLFGGLLFCGRCGAKMYGKSRAGGSISFICSKNNIEGRIKDEIRQGLGCTSHRVREEYLVGLVNRFAVEFIREPRFKSIIENMDDAGQQKKIIERDIIRHRTQKENLMTKASLVYDDKLEGRIPEMLFENKISEITEKIFGAEKELARLEMELVQLSKNKASEDIIEAAADAICKQGITRNTLTLLFKRILVYEPGDIKPEAMEEFDILEETYKHVRESGGIFFVQNFY